MKILSVKTRLPFPIRAGEDLVDYGLIKAIAERHEVTLVSPIYKSSISTNAASELAKYCRNIITVPLQDKEVFFIRLFKKLRREFRYWFKFIPLAVTDNHFHSFNEVLEQVVEKGSFDLAEIEYWFMGQYAPIIKNKCPTILLEHNSFIRDMQRKNLRSPGKFGRHFRHWYYNKSSLSRYELKVCGLFDWVLFLSSRDMEEIQKTGLRKDRSKVLPVPYDIEQAKNIVERPQRSSLVFLGGMQTPYNIDSLRYFYHSILPIVKRELPDVCLTVVGTLPNIKVRNEFKTPNIRFVGFQPRLFDFIRQFSVFIVPVQNGSGIRTKIIEAMALGMPIVSTSIGVEGLVVSNGVDILLADYPEDFAYKVVHLLTDDSSRRNIAIEALNRFRTSYSYEAINEKTRQVYEEIKESFD